MSSTWWLSLGGGALIGVAASLLLVFAHQTAGVSGILAGAISPKTARGDRAWRIVFLAGLMMGGVVLYVLKPAVFGSNVRSLSHVLVAGLLVGFGTRLSGGCTSGHGVCGISHLSTRSILATMIFIATGVVTVWLLGPKG